MYGVFGGKSEADTIESNVAMIFPVTLEITNVAAETRPDLIAREEAMTEIGSASAASAEPLGGDLGGVG